MYINKNCTSNIKIIRINYQSLNNYQVQFNHAKDNYPQRARMNIAKINSKIVYIYLYIYIYGGLKAHNLNLLTKVNCQDTQ